MTPFITATPNSAMKPTPGRDVEGRAGEMQRDQPAERRQRHDAEDEQHLPQHAELGIEQDDHQPEDQADDQREARLRALLVLELAAPFDAISSSDRTTTFSAIALLRLRQQRRQIAIGDN